jgi:hypothetical protein
MAEIQRRQAIPAQFGNSHFAKAFARIRIAPHVEGLVNVLRGIWRHSCGRDGSMNRGARGVPGARGVGGVAAGLQHQPVEKWLPPFRQYPFSGNTACSVIHGGRRQAGTLPM